MAYPSTISTLATPQATDRLNSPSHSQLHQNENSGITEIQTFVGTLASTAGTLIYDIRASASDGGGHVQSANKGGTGQTTYNKGDLLVASSASVLTKLSVSSTVGEVLTVDSSQPTGVKWGPAVANTKLAVISSVTGVSGVGTEAVIFSASILGSVLGTNNAVRFTGLMSNYQMLQSNSTKFLVKYGNNSVLTIAPLSSASDSSGYPAKLEFIMAGSNSTSSQKAFGTFESWQSESEVAGALTVEISKVLGMSYGTSSIESSATQNLVITASIATSGANPVGSIVGQFLTLEKIA